MNKADLHIHTTESDGKLSPSEVVHLAIDRGIEAIAITDHDTINGYLKACEVAYKSGLELVPGVEITSDFAGEECHILAYGFDIDHSGLTELLNSQRNLRLERARKMVGKLNGMGIEITMDEVLAEARTTAVGRVHMAKVLIQKKYAVDMQDVFLRYLGNHAHAYHKSNHQASKKVIDIVHDAGGIAVLAHPADRYNFLDLKSFLDDGIDGIECIHPSHDYRLQKKFTEYVESHDLLLTGGSDFHGTREKEFVNFGVITIASEYLENIKNGIQLRRNPS